MKSEIFKVNDKIEEYIIERSKFIAYSYNCDSKDKMQGILKDLKREHPKATHICYAYRFFESDIDGFVDNFNFTQSYFDDGEPSGTAGAPILRAIEENDLYNTLIVVVRYFGGIKLGAAGLTRAYKKSASLAIDKVCLTLQDIYEVESDYSGINSIINFCDTADVNILDKTFDMTAKIIIAASDISPLKAHFESTCTIKHLGRKYV